MCTHQINGKPDESVSSDFITTTMLASHSFNAVLELVQTSCLNFQIQVSRFSAIISLKKSFIKDKCGNLVLPPDRRIQSENMKNEPVVDAPTENTTVKNEAKENAHIESLQLELNKLVIENKKYKEKVREQEEEICDLNKTVKVKNEVINKLNPIRPGGGFKVPGSVSF